MDYHKREIVVGGLVLVAATVFVLGTLWLKGKAIAPRNTVLVRYADVGNLKVGAPVKISGVAAGRVEEIELEDVGKVLVRLSLPRNVVARVDATADIFDVGFLGDAAVRFDPGKSAHVLPKGQVITGGLYAGVGGLLDSLSGDARKTMASVRGVLDPEITRDLRRTLAAMERTLDLLSNTRTGPTAQLNETLKAVQALSLRMDSTLANPAVGRTLSHLDTATANLARLSAQFTTTGAHLDSLLSSITQGRGTLGKLATDSALYQDVRGTLQSLKALTDSLNKYPGRLTVNVKLF
ncbi:MAG: MlaD family protein [Gemmatimonadota bacterium]